MTGVNLKFAWGAFTRIQKEKHALKQTTEILTSSFESTESENAIYADWQFRKVKGAIIWLVKIVRMSFALCAGEFIWKEKGSNVNVYLTVKKVLRTVIVIDHDKDEEDERWERNESSKEKRKTLITPLIQNLILNQMKMKMKNEEEFEEFQENSKFWITSK